MSSRSKRLAKGRKQRTQAAQMMGALEAGEVSVKLILTSRPAALRGVRLWRLLCRTPHLGEVGARRVCERANIWPETRLADLTGGEVMRVVEHLPPRVR